MELHIHWEIALAHKKPTIDNWNLHIYMYDPKAYLLTYTEANLFQNYRSPVYMYEIALCIVKNHDCGIKDLPLALI